MFNKFKEKLKSWAKKVADKPDISEDTEKAPVKFNKKKEKYEPDLEKVKEKIEEETSKPGEKGFFRKISSKVKKTKITPDEFEFYGEELKMLLLESNVAFEVADKIIQELKEKIVDKELLKKEIEGEIKDCLKETIENILIEPFDVLEKIKEKKEKPFVILFCGINGVGKTTTIAKFAEMLKKEKMSCVMAAADTFRTASIEQIKEHGENTDTKVIAHEYGSDPASVGFDAIKYAEKNSIDCVLIDTAGRMHTSRNLMNEIEKIVKVCKPDLKIFVGESTTGNDATEQVKSFDEAIEIDGIILTKADIDEKGGTALSVGYTTKKPILYLSTGQEYNQIEKFDKEKFIGKLDL